MTVPDADLEWLVDPVDHMQHAWRLTGDGGAMSLCDRTAWRAELAVPADDHARHPGCLLALGDLWARQQPAGVEWRDQ